MYAEGTSRIVGREAARFLRKDPAKWKLVAGLYGSSLLGQETGKIIRTSYFFMRHLDDLLDGEMTRRNVPQDVLKDPVGYANSLRDQIVRGKFDLAMPIARLASYALPRLEERATPKDDPRHNFVTLIDAMVFDHHRRTEHKAVNAQDLYTYYNDLLNSSLDIAFVGLRAQMRTAMIPTFAPSQGRLYSIRDLSTDWKLGIINIPSEVLSAANITTSSSAREVLSNHAISTWAHQEIIEAREGIVRSQEILNSIAEPVPKLLLRGLGGAATDIRFSPDTLS